LLLKTHADPSLLLRMTVWVIAFPHRVSAHHGQPERLSMLRTTSARGFFSSLLGVRQLPAAFLPASLLAGISTGSTVFFVLTTRLA